MFIDKSTLAEKKKKSNIFTRFTDRLTGQQRGSKRDQSVQTTLHPSILLSSQLNQRISSSKSSSAQTPSHRRRSSLRTFLALQSPKPIPLIHRTRRRSINLKTPKRLSSECLQVALIRKIQPVNHSGSPILVSSTTSFYSYQQISNDETANREDYLSIGPMKWSTPNRTTVYKTSSPNNNNNSGQHPRLYTVDPTFFFEHLRS